jgi:hypothetical protein
LVAAREVDPWQLELRFDLFDAQLETEDGTIEIEQVEAGGKPLLRMTSKALTVGTHRYRLSALVGRDEGGHLGFATFEISAPSGWTVSRSRFAELEARLLDIAREWASENASL